MGDPYALPPPACDIVTNVWTVNVTGVAFFIVCAIIVVFGLWALGLRK